MKRHTSRKSDEGTCGEVEGQFSGTSTGSKHTAAEVPHSLNTNGHCDQQTAFENDHPHPQAIDSSKQGSKLAGKKRSNPEDMAQPPSPKRSHIPKAGTASKVGKKKPLHRGSKLPSASTQSHAKSVEKNSKSQRKRPNPFLSSNSLSSFFKLPRITSDDPYSPAVDNSTVTRDVNTPTISNPSHYQDSLGELGNSTFTDVSGELTNAEFPTTPTSSNHTTYEVPRKQVMKQTPEQRPTGSTSVGVKDAQPNTPTVSAKTRTSGQSSGKKGFSGTNTPTSTDLDKAQTELCGHTTEKTCSDESNANIQDSSIEKLATLSVVSVSDSGRKAKKGGARGKKNHTQSDKPLTVTRKTNANGKASIGKFKVSPRSKPRPQLKSKTSGDVRIRKSRCKPKDRHRCPSCSLPDCGTCKNCRYVLLSS